MLLKLMEEETVKLVDSASKRVKEFFVSTCKEVLGPKKHHHKDWISAETLSKIKERKEKKLSIPAKQKPRSPRHRRSTHMLTRGPKRAPERKRGRYRRIS